MNQKDRLIYLITHLMEEHNPDHGMDIPPLLPLDEGELRQIFRALVNVRLPQAIDEEFLRVQDDYLQAFHASRLQTGLSDLEPVEDQIYLWQGDITSLKVDAIVNAANSEFIGCFIPNHHCIDNEIQSKGGYQIRLDMADIRYQQNGGRKEPMGRAQLTPGHNLPARYIIHTVAPITNGRISPLKSQLLGQCYTSVLKKADDHQLNSIAVCCIGTGQFGFPQEEAADIAIDTVKTYLRDQESDLQVIFNVFEDSDLEIYQRKLKKV